MDDRIVAFLDVLGFKQMVEAGGQEALVRKYELLVGQIELSAAHNRFVVDDRGDEPRARADLSRSSVNVLVVSDSIVIYSERADALGVREVSSATWRLLSGAMYVGMPLRGALVVGPLSRINGTTEGANLFDVRALIGKGLVDAYRLEGTQDWSGAVVDQAVIDLYLREELVNDPSHVQLKALEQLGVLRRYSVPFKDGPRTEWTIGWPFANRSRPSEEAVRKAFSQHGKSLDADLSKFNNTVEYLNAMRPEESGTPR